MRAPKYQFFTLEEYQGRLDALRRRMEERGIDVLLVNSPENLYYISGYQTPGLLLVPDADSDDGQGAGVHHPAQ